jgi:hypothetical protein
MLQYIQPGTDITSMPVYRSRPLNPFHPIHPVQGFLRALCELCGKNPTLPLKQFLTLDELFLIVFFQKQFPFPSRNPNFTLSSNPNHPFQSLSMLRLST